VIHYLGRGWEPEFEGRRRQRKAGDVSEVIDGGNRPCTRERKREREEEEVIAGFKYELVAPIWLAWLVDTRHKMTRLPVVLSAVARLSRPSPRDVTSATVHASSLRGVHFYNNNLKKDQNRKKNSADARPAAVKATRLMRVATASPPPAVGT
jgi:hypothetical protein